MSDPRPTSQPQPAEPLADEQLVSYLDGELEPQESRRIESLLASDAALRKRLVHLQRAWDLLGELQPAGVDASFTRSTLEMVVVEAAEEAQQSQLAIPRRRRRRWVAAVVVALLAAGAGFAAVALLWPDPNKNLLQDLPVVENLDPYRHVGDMEFLRLLADGHLFDRDRTGEEAKP